MTPSNLQQLTWVLKFYRLASLRFTVGLCDCGHWSDMDNVVFRTPFIRHDFMFLINYLPVLGPCLFSFGDDRLFFDRVLALL